MRKTHALIQVAIALLDDPTGRHWGYQLSKQSGVRSGVLSDPNPDAQ
jgi:PadR family transcriptional regulator PadR